MIPVTDPALIAQLERESGPPGGQPQVPTGAVPIQDPTLVDFLERSAEAEDMTALTRGAMSGVKQLHGMVGGATAAIGDLLGSEDAQALGREMYERYATQAAAYAGHSPTLEEVFQSEEQLDDFMTWLGQNVGQGAATAVPALLAGVVNPWLGAGVVYGMGVGETYSAQLDEAEDPNVAIALAAGVPYAVAERLFGAGSQLANVIRRGGGTVSKNYLARVAKEIPKTMASEALAEASQETIVSGAADIEAGRDPLAEIQRTERLKQIGEAAAAGAAAGGPFGAATAIPGPRVQEAKRPGVRPARPEAPTEAPETPVPPPEPAAPPPGATPVTDPELVEELEAAPAVDPATGIATTAPPLTEEGEEAAEAAAAPAAPTAEEVAAEAAKAEPEPTEAQKEAGNYRKGHVKVHGLDVTIENAKGSIRRGTDPSGAAWEVEMPAHYGYIRRSEGGDGEQVDVYVGEEPESSQVYVIDQIDPDTGRFDEHKVILGTRNLDDAYDLYTAGFSDGRGGDRAGAITEMDIGEFQGWLEEGDTRRPIGYREPQQEDRAERPAPGLHPEASLETPPPTRGGVSPSEHVQTDLLGGPDVTEAETALRDQAESYLADLRAEYETADDVRDEIDRLVETYGGTDREALFQEVKRLEAAETAGPARPPMKEEPEAAEGPALRELSRKYQAHLLDNTLTRAQLQKQANEVMGGTLAEGAYSWRDAYDAMELAVNRSVMQDREIKAGGAVTAAQAKAGLDRINELYLGRIPSQTRRTDEQISFQQFSTPADYAYVAAWVANISPQDVILEPSAGTGSMSIHGNEGAANFANELAPRRADLLRSLIGSRSVFTEDASQLHNVLPREIQPTVVLMNPPFSQTAGRMGDRKQIMEGARHVEQALKRLEPGGRLVAIVGRGMSPEAPKFKDWWGKIASAYTVRANVGVPGAVYRKYGTTFDTRLLVIDKGEGAEGTTVAGEAKSLAGLIDMLEPIRGERADLAEQRPAEPERQEAAGDRGRRAGRDRAVPAPVDDVGDRPRDTRPPEDVVRPAERGRGAAAERGAGERDEVPAGERQRRREAESARPGPRGGDAERGRGERAGGPVPRPAEPDQPADDGRAARTGVEAAELENVEAEAQEHELTDSLYEAYKPQRVRIAGAKAHPGPLVQSSAMAAVEPPAADYAPKIPKSIINQGLLSTAQLETIVYAGQAHKEMLPHVEGQQPFRRGFFIGDGTGVGKGREISGIILDNMNQGRKKAIWLSANQRLKRDAERDWSGLKQDKKAVFALNNTQLDSKVGRTAGIMFTTYDTLASGQNKQPKPGEALRTRLDQIVEWVGEDFDGVIAFDEAHYMGNALEMGTGLGKKKPSARALAGIEIQQRLPNARIVYVSATGATEVHNLAYTTRLGLWGRGTAFSGAREFVSEINAGGVAAMELVARDMKAQGSYIARNLSYDGVEYDRLEHALTAEQRDAYDTMAQSWQVVLNNVHDVLETTYAYKNGRARAAAMSQFWGAHQRFFNQVLTAMQMPSVLKRVQKDIDADKSVVLQLVNTNEAQQERALATVETQEDLETLDMTPLQTLQQYIETSFPVLQYEEYTDENGNTRSRVVLDSDEKPVESQEALERREELLSKVAGLPVPDGPLDQLLNHFGTAQVAEVTGRRRRIVVGEEGRKVEEKRSKSTNLADIKSFNDGKKRILVFSDAGGTGASYHADKTVQNQQRRMHYLLQPGWRADNAVQGFGRTHRSNQAQPPFYWLVTTDIKGHRRFISSVARRLDQLGALTKGQRQAGSQGLFSEKDNLESDLARDALRRFFHDVYRGDVEGLDIKDLEREMGLKLTDPDTGGLVKVLPDVPQFLNRMLSLTIDRQDTVFDAFDERLNQSVELAIAAGTLDAGVETLRADKVEKLSEQTVYTQPTSGAETKYVKLRLHFKNHPRSLDTVIRDWANNKPLGIVRSKGKGIVYVIAKAPNRTEESGRIVRQNRLISALGYRYIDAEKLTGRDWEPIKGRDEARKAWEDHVATLPEYRIQEDHLITGLILPIWDRLPQKRTRIYRVQTDAGERLLGRVIGAGEIGGVLERLGATATAETASPSQLIQQVLKGHMLKLSNGWIIRRAKVNNEWRIEVSGPTYYNRNELYDAGVFEERINYKARYFIPTGKNAASIFGDVIEYRPVVSNLPPGGVEVTEDGDTMYAVERAYTGKYRSDLDDISDEIGELARRIVPTARVRTVRKLFAQLPGRKGQTKVRASYRATENLITISLAGRTPAESVRLLRHEAVHALKAMGMFRDAEWRLLEERARDDWMARHNVKQLYANFDAETQVEEAVAMAYEHWRSGRRESSKIDGIFQRIRTFITRLGNLLKGRGFATVDDVFERVEGGYVGRRKGRARAVPTEGDRFAVGNVLSPAEQAAVESMRGKIGTKPKTVKQRFTDTISDRLADRFKQGVLDDVHAISLPEMAANDGKLYEDARSAYKLARLSRGIEDVVFEAMYFGVPVWKEGTTQINESIRPIMQIVDDLGERVGDFEIYMAGRRADELMAQGKEKLFKQSEIDAALKLDQVYPDFKDLFDELQAYNDGLLDFVEQSGLIDKKTRTFFEEMHKNYVPFYRIMEGGDKKAPKARLGFAGQHPAFMRLRGSERNIERPFINLERNVHRLIEMSIKNVVMLRMEQINAELGGTIMNTVGRKAKKVLTTNRQMVKDLEDQGLQITPEDQVDPEALRVIWSFGNAPKGDNILSWVRGGRVIYGEVHDPMLFRSLTAVARRNSIPWIGALRAPKHLLTAAVGLEPTFQVRNAVRDTVHASVISHIGFRPGYDSAKGFGQVLTKSKNFKEFLRAGGGMSALFDADRKSVHQVMEHKLGEATAAARVIGTARAGLGWLQRFESTFEYATRMGAFQRLRDQGVPLMEAAYQAREISTDFGMRGEWGPVRFFVETVPFLNAGMQGLYRTYRGAGAPLSIARRGGRAQLGKAGVEERQRALLSFMIKGSMIAAASIGLYLLNREDERFKNLPEFERDMYWHFFVGKQHYKLPKPFEVGAIFGTIPERMAEAAIEKNGKRFAERMLWTFSEMFRLDIVPQAVKPPLRLYANWDEFRERPVVPRHLEQLRPAEQYDHRTPYTLIETGRLLDVSPKKIEALVNGYLGAWGSYVFTAADTMFEVVGGYPEKPKIQWSDRPVLRGFIGHKTPRATYWQGEFYKMKEEVDRLYASILRLQANGEVDRARDLMVEGRSVLGLRDSLNKMNAMIRKLNRAIQATAQDRYLSAREKADRIESLQDAKNRIFRTMERLQPLTQGK